MWSNPSMFNKLNNYNRPTFTLHASSLQSSTSSTNTREQSGFCDLPSSNTMSSPGAARAGFLCQRLLLQLKCFCMANTNTSNSVSPCWSSETDRMEECNVVLPLIYFLLPTVLLLSEKEAVSKGPPRKLTTMKLRRPPAVGPSGGCLFSTFLNKKRNKS